MSAAGTNALLPALQPGGILFPVVFQLQMLSLPWQGRELLDKATGGPGVQWSQELLLEL